MRKVSREPAPAPTAHAARTSSHEEILHDERTYRFLTPVFGGGVRVNGQHKPHDGVTPVRVPSLRGQLRFWWRACNPHGCTDPEQLWKKEAVVFGSTNTPSRLGLSIVTAPGPARDVHVLKDRFVVVDNRHDRAYDAFPLRDPNQGIEHGVLHEHPGDWTIAVSYPGSITRDVEAAFWAWAHFGGLGGRTRRGFGAIEEVSRSRGTLATIEDGWKRFVSGNEGVPWPHLQAFESRRLRTKSGGLKTGTDAQEYLLGVLRRLRQGDIGRRPQADDVPGMHPGRSYWPEPDTIRKLTGRWSPEHSKPVTQVEAFPRAAFGLPLIFHFKDRSDPPDTTLVPQVAGSLKGRLASPLLLRPHRALDGSIEALALVLAHPEPTGYVLVENKNKQKPPYPVTRWKLTEHEALRLGVGGRPSPLVTMRGTLIADPIARFLEEIR
jgi:CRISPR-associated protein Cmr1